MPKKDGIEVLEALNKAAVSSPIVMISGHGDLEVAVESMRLGAFDYISKPPDLNRLLTTVRNALTQHELTHLNQSLSNENKSLKKKIAKKYEIVGDSEALNAILDVIDKVAPTDARVLITGSNGTGKELVARRLHALSQRNKSSFVEVNCAAIPSELIESELFGHVKGSFTGAYKDKSGKFESANGGTLFLDEIGDMSLSAQAKVLRALQEHKINKVGSDKAIKVDVRLLAATNKDLKKMIAEGKFREDLYHRIGVILIEVPSLADRKSDIPKLVAHFADQIAKDQGMSSKQFSDSALKLLTKHSWTGNIRELRNVVERLLILGNNPVNEQDVKSFVNID